MRKQSRKYDYFQFRVYKYVHFFQSKEEAEQIEREHAKEEISFHLPLRSLEILLYSSVLSIFKIKSSCYYFDCERKHCACTPYRLNTYERNKKYDFKRVQSNVNMKFQSFVVFFVCALIAQGGKVDRRIIIINRAHCLSEKETRFIHTMLFVRRMPLYFIDGNLKSTKRANEPTRNNKTSINPFGIGTILFLFATPQTCFIKLYRAMTIPAIWQVHLQHMQG